MLPRRSTAAYTFAGTKVSIPKGLMIWIPVYGIHRDPDIYPNPDVFNPENFNEDAVEARHPMTYLPFGDGPRNCIGTRSFITKEINLSYSHFFDRFSILIANAETTCIGHLWFS